MRLQKFGIKDSHYERPGHKWVCGRASEGRPCATGPDEQGLCSASVECFPLRDGDRWKCTRDQLRGGSCTDGPLPDGSCSSRVPQCLPVLSLRNKRGWITRWLILSSLALLLIGLNSSSSNRLSIVSPGPLSTKHGTFSEPCNICHTAADENPITWIAQTAFSPHDRRKESRLCIRCHDYGDHAFRAHSLDPKILADTRTRLLNAGNPDSRLFLLSRLNFVPANAQRNDDPSLSCASCHKEHKGQEADLKVIDNQQCQSCHVLKFNAFSDGHPEISRYTFNRRTRIVFDHQSHKAKHFPEDKYPGERKEFLCPDCHEVDATGNKMLNPGFDQGCRNCHVAEFDGKNSEKIGLPVVSIPGLDMETLIERKIPVGEWPGFANNEKKIPAFMRDLLSTDPAFQKAAPVLLNLKDLGDLSGASDEELRAVQTLAWAVKKLMYDLVTGGHGALEKRLHAIFGKDLTHESMSALVDGLSVATVVEAQLEWFPQLKSEIAQYNANSPPVAKDLTDVPEEAEESQNDQTDQGKAAAADKSADSDILSDDPDAIDFGWDAADESEPDGDDSTKKEESNTAEESQMADEEWVELGGWYQNYATLSYRPKDHADRFLKLWLSNTARLAEDASSPEAGLFKELTDSESPGKCTKCHSIDQTDSGALKINWFGKKPDPEVHEFTTFSHKSHFSLIDDKGCITCHSWNKHTDDEFAASYKQWNPLVYTSNFSELKNETCSECHTENAAGESCLICHNYHIGTFPNLMQSIKTQ
ncbi:MAG: hypothetical protein ACU843_00775 [Gammaproteobacteria bacterium]